MCEMPASHPNSSPTIPLMGSGQRVCWSCSFATSSWSSRLYNAAIEHSCFQPVPATMSVLIPVPRLVFERGHFTVVCRQTGCRILWICRLGRDVEPDFSRGNIFPCLDLVFHPRASPPIPSLKIFLPVISGGPGDKETNHVPVSWIISGNGSWLHGERFSPASTLLRFARLLQMQGSGLLG